MFICTFYLGGRSFLRPFCLRLVEVNADKLTFYPPHRENCSSNLLRCSIKFRTLWNGTKLVAPYLDNLDSVL